MKLFIGAEELPIVWTDAVGIKESPPYLLMHSLPGTARLIMVAGKTVNTFWQELKDLFTVPDTYERDDLRLRQVCNGASILTGFIGLASAASSFAGSPSVGSMVYPSSSQVFLISLMTFFLPFPPGIGLRPAGAWH